MANQTLELKNVNMLTKEQYNGIANASKNELYVVEIKTYSDNKGNWYRIDPDGWCVQGGIQTTINQDSTTTITLLKPYKDTLYNVTTQTLSTGSNNNSNNNSAETYTKNTGSFIIYTYSYKKSVYWEAKGYIA